MKRADRRTRNENTGLLRTSQTSSKEMENQTGPRRRWECPVPSLMRCNLNLGYTATRSTQESDHHIYYGHCPPAYRDRRRNRKPGVVVHISKFFPHEMNFHKSKHTTKSTEVHTTNGCSRWLRQMPSRRSAGSENTRLCPVPPFRSRSPSRSHFVQCQRQRPASPSSSTTTSTAFMSDSDGDFSDELLELAGAGDKRRKKSSARSSAKRRKAE